MRLLLTAFIVILYCPAQGFATPAPAGKATTWVNGDFRIPAPSPGGFSIVDVGERYGEWRVVGQPGNVIWTSTSYVHDGFNFAAPPDDVAWVNLAGISQAATGIVHGPFPTTVGSPYTLTFEVGNIVDPGGRYGTSSSVAVYQNATLLMTATNSGGAGTKTENWKAFSITFTADQPYTNIAFVNADPPGDMNCGIGNTLLAPATAAASTRFGAQGARP